MEIGSDIDKHLIYNLLDKKYDSIIFKMDNNFNTVYYYYTNLNKYYNFSLQRNRQQTEKFKNALKLNNSCNKILVYNYKDLSLQTDFIEFIFYLLLKCRNITNFSINSSSLFDYTKNQHNILSDLSNLLINNISLKEISLKDNYLMNVNPIFEALRENNTLEILDLSFNRIYDISILMDVLQNNNTIKIIDLSYNNFCHTSLLDDLVKRYPNIKFIF